MFMYSRYYTLRPFDILRFIGLIRISEIQKCEWNLVGDAFLLYLCMPRGLCFMLVQYAVFIVGSTGVYCLVYP